MPAKINFKIIIDYLKERIREYYPFFFGFYVLALLVSLFSKTWSSWFYWPAFHFLIVLFAILFIAWGPKIEWRRPFVATVPIWMALWNLSVRLYGYFMGLPKTSRYKILSILVILLYFYLTGVHGFDFLVIAYALVSVLFVIDSRIAGGIALMFIAFCPLLLALEKGAWAEDSAIYAFYFLVITVATQLRELSYYDRRSGEDKGKTLN